MSMKKFIASIISFLILLNFNAQELEIKSEKAQIEFNYVEEQTIGSINGVTGKIVFNSSNLSESYFEARANIKSINTSNKTRDKHLNTAEYFHTDKYPEIIFIGKEVNLVEDKYIVKGSMTIKDITHPSEISFSFQDNTFTGKTIIYSNDYNLHERKKREDSKILVKITVPVI